MKTIRSKLGIKEFRNPGIRRISGTTGALQPSYNTSLLLEEGEYLKELL